MEMRPRSDASPRDPGSGSENLKILCQHKSFNKIIYATWDLLSSCDCSESLWVFESLNNAAVVVVVVIIVICRDCSLSRRQQKPG